MHSGLPGRSLWQQRLTGPKTFQNLSVSSAAPETTVSPSGLCARCSTRLVCPVSSAIFTCAMGASET